MTHWSSVITICVILAVASGYATPIPPQSTGEASSYSMEPASHGTSATPIIQSQQIRLADPEAGIIEVTISYEIPDGVTDLQFEVTRTDDIDIVDTNGFHGFGNQTFEWTGQGEGGSVTIRYSADTGFYLDEGEVGAGPYWAITVVPSTYTHWEYDGPDPGIQYQREAADGVVGDWLVYLGEYEMMRTEVQGEQIRIVIPEAADPVSPPAEIRSSLEWAAGRDIGPRSETVMAIIAPTDEIKWAVTGKTVGNDLWVVDEASTEAPENWWVGHYMITRQNRDGVTPETEWLIGALPEYYGYLASLDRNVSSFKQFTELLAVASDSPNRDVVLSEPTTWHGTDANFQKGALVLASIDFKLRKATGGSVTIDAVIAAWSRAETFDQTAFLNTIEELSNAEVRAAARRLTETGETPSIWTYEEHIEVFGDVVFQHETPTPTPSPTQSPTATNTVTSSPTETPDTEAPSQPGFGFAVTIGSIAIFGYLIKRTGVRFF